MNEKIKKISKILIYIGIFLRLATYLKNRSLWLDEAFITLNILDKSFGELFKSLDFNQGAPIGFLLVEKILVNILGDSEYVLRLLPFLCSIGSLYLFNVVSRYYLKDWAAIVSLALFVFIDPLIYYASEVKQYSCDVLFTLFILHSATYMDRGNYRVYGAVWYGLLGAFAIWFSYPSSIIFLGFGIFLIIRFFNSGLWKKLGYVLVSLLIFEQSLIALYLFHLRYLSRTGLEIFDKSCFLSFPPTPAWFIAVFNHIFLFSKLEFYYVPKILFLIGFFYLLFKKRNDLLFLFIFLLSIVIASAFHLYPIVHRLTLFIIPVFILIISSSLELFFNRGKKSLTIIGIFISVLLLIPQCTYSIKNLIQPQNTQEIKQVINYMMERKIKNDTIYIYHASQYPFRYYATKYKLPKIKVDSSEYKSDVLNRNYDTWNKENKIIVGITAETKEQYHEDLNKLKGRVWFVFSHFWPGEKKLFLNHLNTIGKKLDSYEIDGYFEGAAVYLYEI